MSYPPPGGGYGYPPPTAGYPPQQPAYGQPPYQQQQQLMPQPGYGQPNYQQPAPAPSIGFDGLNQQPPNVSTLLAFT